MLQEPRYLANRFLARAEERSEYAGILTTEVRCVYVEAIDVPRSPQLDDAPAAVRMSASARWNEVTVDKENVPIMGRVMPSRFPSVEECTFWAKLTLHTRCRLPTGDRE